MNPKVTQKLMSSNKRVMKEYILFVQKEAYSLNTLEDIASEDPIQVAVEVKARKLAYTKLKNILDPLINNQEVEKFNNKEYVI